MHWRAAYHANSPFDAETESDGGNEALGRLENAFLLAARADEVARKIKRAVRERRLPKGRPAALLDAALEAGVIDAKEVELVRTAEAARQDAIEVDSFSLEEYMKSSVAPESPASIDVQRRTSA